MRPLAVVLTLALALVAACGGGGEDGTADTDTGLVWIAENGKVETEGVT